jgi:LPXTG-motif cell wall anchor domain protein
LTEVPGEAPIHELPEKILTEVPNEAPVHELTELVVTEVPKDAPVLELEELKIPEEPKKEETSAPVPSVIKNEVPKKELPKTGQKEETGTLQVLGAILGLAALGLTLKSKKKED